MIRLIILLIILPVTVSAEKISITAHYREAANVFLIMDCVSGWWDKTFCYDDGAYQLEWKKLFGISNDDFESFKKYDQIRKKYYRGMGASKEDAGAFDDGIFPKKAQINEDLLAPSFYGSAHLDEAYEKLTSIMSKDDLDWIKIFYKKFQPRYQKILDESKVFAAKAKIQSKALSNKRYSDFYTQILQYYGVLEKLQYEVIYTWFPPLNRDLAVPVDRFLVLSKNPTTQLNWNDEEVIFHEIVHTISVRQSQEQKEKLSKMLLASCAIDQHFPKGKKNRILEEPMAVVLGQILFLEKFFPERLKLDSTLYRDRWVSDFAIKIYPTIKAEFESGKRFSVETIKKLVPLCNEQLKIADYLN